MMLSCARSAKVWLIVLALVALLAVPGVALASDGEVRVMEDLVIPAGTVASDVVAVIGDIDIAGTVNGDAVAVIGDIHVRSGGVVRGNAVSVLGRVIREPGSVVNEDTVSVDGFFGIGRPNIHLGGIPFLAGPMFGLLGLGFRLVAMIGYFALAVLVLSLFRDNVEASATALSERPWRMLLVGFLAAILLVPVGIALMITIIGIPLAFLLPFFAWAAKFFGYVAVALLVGRKVFGLMGQAASGPIWEVFLGVLAIGLIGAVPIAGLLVSLAVTLLGLGVALETRFGTNRPWFRGQPPQGPTS